MTPLQNFNPYDYARGRVCKNCRRKWRDHQMYNCPVGDTKFQPLRKNRFDKRAAKGKQG